MSRVLTPAGQLARLIAGRPKILLIDPMARPARWIRAGIEVWIAEVRSDGDFLLAAAAARHPEGPAVAVAAAPAGFVALLFARLQDQTPWRTWFTASGAAHPPEFIDTTPAAALRRVAARALEDCARARAELADLHLALAELRVSHEQSQRSAITLAHRLGAVASGTLTLIAAAEIGSATARLDKRHPLRIQNLATRLDRCAAVGIHLVRARGGGEDALRVRLSGVESGRIAGSWLIPFAALVPGWLTLELPTPEAWAAETAQLELHLTCGDDGGLELARDRLAGFAVHRAGQDGAQACAHPLAVRIWAAESGLRQVAPAFWDATEPGAGGHQGQVPLAMPLAAYADLEVITQGVARGFDPAQVAPMRVSLQSGQQTLVRFPRVAVTGMDLIEARFTAAKSPERLAVALWLQPVDLRIGHEADLALQGADVAWSGWHSFAAATHEARIGLEVPADASPNLQLVVVIDASLSKKKAAEAGVAITRILLHANNPARASRRRTRLIGADLSPRALEALPLPQPALSMGEVVLDEHYDDGNAYRHLDMRITALKVGDFHWPHLKFRLVVDRGRACVEFRDIASWPNSLQNWNGAEADEHGRRMRLAGEASEIDGLRTEASPPDLALIHAVVRCLRSAVAQATTGFAEPDAVRWRGIAEQVGARLHPHAQLLEKEDSSP